MKIARVPNQRQQAVGEKLNQYQFRQRRNLQRDWSTLAQSINQLSQTGVAAELPPAGIPGRLFLATDTLYLYIDNGNGHWVKFGPGGVV